MAGAAPDDEQVDIVELLEHFAAGRMDDEEHMRQVLKSAGLATPARRQVD
jgi:hypothetical protein